MQAARKPLAENDRQVRAHAQRTIEEGMRIFRSLALLKLNAVVGVIGKFDQASSIGTTTREGGTLS